MEFPVVLGLSAILGLIGLGVLLGWRYERQRTVKLAELAGEMSLEFVPDGDDALLSELSDLPLMQRGHSQRLHNLMRERTQSVDLNLFDYRYTTGSGKNQSTHKLSVAVFDSPQLSLAPFELRPESFLHRIAGAFGYQDIDFGDHPMFNREYLLRGLDEHAVRQVFTVDVVQHFEQLVERSRTIAEVNGHGNRLIVATRRAKPDQMRAFLEDAFGIFGILKSGKPGQDDPS